MLAFRRVVSLYERLVCIDLYKRTRVYPRCNVIPFEKFPSYLFLMVSLVLRVYLIGKINASYRFFSLSTRDSHENFLVKNERIEFQVKRQ